VYRSGNGRTCWGTMHGNFGGLQPFNVSLGTPLTTVTFASSCDFPRLFRLRNVCAAEQLRRLGTVSLTRHRQVRGHVIDDVTAAVDDDVTKRPRFGKTQRNVSVLVGERAVLRCRVFNLANRVVRTHTRIHTHTNTHTREVSKHTAHLYGSL